MSGGRMHGLTLSALALAVLIPAAAQAARVGGPGGPERAHQLQVQAEALFSQPARWSKAAKLLERSAALRDASDPEAYDCLASAGRIRAALHQNDAAIRLLTRAGDNALARGDVLDAAESYVMAAHVAVAAKDLALAQQLGEKVKLLSTSPLLSAEQRVAMAARID